MLLFKRLVTAGLCFVPLVFVFFLGTLMFGGAVAGGVAGAKDPDNAQQAGRQAGEEFGEQYGGIVMLASIGLAGVASGVLTFGGVLPWCRKKEDPANPEDPSADKQAGV